MNLCDDGHEEVCYEGSCPVCDLIAEHDNEITILIDKISNLEVTIDVLEKELDNG